jgi:hypothetical protein
MLAAREVSDWKKAVDEPASGAGLWLSRHGASALPADLDCALE